jgi:hypothetical protein
VAPAAFSNITRGIILRGAGLAHLWLDALALFAMGTLLLVDFHMSDEMKKRIKIALTVFSILLPFGFVAWVASADGSPTNSKQEEILGFMVGKAILFAIFANLTIWWPTRPSPK